MYKLIAADLDETLLDSNHEIPQRVVDVIAAARERGVKFVPSTGRPFASVAGNLKTLGLDGRDNEYVISFNGGVITRNCSDEPLTTCELPFDTTETLWRYGYDRKLCMHLYTLDTVYMWNLYDWERVYVEGRMNIVETAEESLDFLRGQTIIKILFCVRDMDYLRGCEAELAGAGVTEGLDVVYSSERYLEFNAPGVNKGVGLRALAEMLGIKQEETVAIGDSTNDLAMIRTAGLGVAVANATDEAKAAADYVCEDTNDQGAVAEAIEKFVLAD